MKRYLLVLLILLTAAVTFNAQGSSKNSLTRIAKRIGETDDLGTIDKLKLVDGSIRAVIEHSISEPELETRTFRSFGDIEHWLDRREVEDFPRRYSLSFKGCGKGICRFESEGGILHNQLYVKEIRYQYRGRRLYIKSIRFLDGD